jgi:hypothetical protein
LSHFRITNWLTDVTKELGLPSVININNFDDESYYASDFPLPACWCQCYKTFFIVTDDEAQ